jgi:hypothetical protein
VWENGSAESFPARLQDEPLNREEFSSPLEARAVSRLAREVRPEETAWFVELPDAGGVRQDVSQSG